jgi:integrase
MSSNEQYRFWQHNNGTIYVVWTERTAHANGEVQLQTRRVSTGSKDWAAAEQYRAQFIAGLNNPASPKEPTIGYLLKRYRDEHAVNTRSLDTIDQHIKALKPFFGNLLPSHISNNLLKEYARQCTISPGTVLRRLGILKAAIHYAEGNRWIEKQPQFIMPVKSPPPRDLWLTREQVQTLLDAAKSHHLKLFIQIAVATGARSGAILDLTWERIDFEKRLIDFGQGHGNKRRTTVPMNDDVYENLKTAQELAQTDHVIEFHGKRLASIKISFRRLCINCNIKASPHVLRHTAATWLVIDGVPLSEVARLLGDSERTVERVYGKHDPDYLRRAVNTLNLMHKKPLILAL